MGEVREVSIRIEIKNIDLEAVVLQRYVAGILELHARELREDDAMGRNGHRVYDFGNAELSWSVKGGE